MRAFSLLQVQMYSIRVFLDSLKFYKKEMQPAAILVAHHLSWCQSHLSLHFGNAVDMMTLAEHKSGNC